MTRARLRRISGPADLDNYGMPGDFVLMNRINFGLNSIFARLGARENFRRMARRDFLSQEDVARFEANAR